MIQFDDEFTDEHLEELHRKEKERSVQSVAAQTGFEYISLRGFAVNPEALEAISEEKARAAQMAGFVLHKNNLGVATLNPSNPKTQAVIKELEAKRYVVSLFMCSQDSLNYVWEMYADFSSSAVAKKGVLEMNPEDIDRLTKQIKSRDDVVAILKNISSVSNARRISETLELMFAGGLALKASDIHIEPEEKNIRLRYRLHGVLQDVADIDPYIYDRIMSRLKILSGMYLNTKAEAQDGRFTFETSSKKVEVRSSVIPGAVGESIVMRLLDPTVASFNLEQIKLNPYIEKMIREQLKKPNGLIITTGPTGSGKTTALYAFLRETHSDGVKIITIENPVEYKVEGIVQTQTGEDYTFASGLRAILRQDPDIIMVGEIRDREVAETAIHAAQTGHLVFSTLHTNSAIAGFARLIDLGVDPRILGTSINVIMGQRLIRVLCPECKKSHTASNEETRLIKYIMSDHPYPTPIPEPLSLYEAAGCDKCGGSGFKGRMGIFEGVAMDDAVEEAILRDPRESVIYKAAKPQKIPTMLHDGIDKLMQGLTSIKELERVIELPKPTEKDPDIKVGEGEEADENDFLSHIVSR